MSKKITMNDLAKAAGCSPSQVSRAFNGKPYVAPEIRERVFAVAKTLNYRNMSNNHQIRIALIGDGFSGECGHRFQQQVIRQAWQKGWLCHIVDSCCLDMIDNFLYDGIICTEYEPSWSKNWGKEHAMPLVMVNSYGSRGDYICSIDPSRTDAAKQVLFHLKTLGHRKIARIHHAICPQDTKIRRGEEEYLAVAAEMNLGDSVKNFIIPADVPLEDTIKNVVESGFTAIHMIHQSYAIKTLSVIRKLGLHVPEDVSLVTYEINRVSQYVDPPLTTIDFDVEGIASRTLEELQLRMQGQGGSRLSIEIPNILHVRCSTGPCLR